MSSLNRREFIKTGSIIALGATVIDIIPSEAPNIYFEKMDLNSGWLLQSSALAHQDGDRQTNHNNKSRGINNKLF